MECVEQHVIRTLFSRAMSDMYRKEVPQYGTLLDLVDEVNSATLAANPDLLASLKKNNDLARISEERHGAIRLGTAAELQTMRELFAVMGMYPVGYYDLSIAELPVHATAFRPVSDADLQKNPFRIFTSLLRTELIDDSEIRHMAEQILASRSIFTPRVRELIAINSAQGGLSLIQAKEFVHEALETFRWHDKAITTLEQHHLLEQVHPLIADVVCFKGPHINHLTPRTLDITTIQKKMYERGLNPKAIIEGPPERSVPILLRQTSFKALEEAIYFPTQQGNEVKGTHKARFGEIEQRGIALTGKGNALYENLLNQVRLNIIPALDGSNATEYYQVLQDQFLAFPDSLDEMMKQGLVYLEYHATEKGIQHAGTLPSNSLINLISDGFLDYTPIIYEDFLPISAAGIFTSNLGDNTPHSVLASGNQQVFEEALGVKVRDPFDLYATRENESLTTALKKIGLASIKRSSE
ncbi:2-oxoadipate dioxygenase/decarboxylase HglS [Legionella bononiensis]|uniref:2-oxoadipate dioxygenase/decarboxylase n=1 Tax=Legionella bononiensis TaxID=2793102 RepID=A0ABS1W6S5_9GAMM|nr:VOC family protein [Legionella bononiensis]MBL7525073.1 VOC family protein [Legionella bononiensis]